MDNIENHKLISSIVASGVDYASVEHVSKILSYNLDSKIFFFNLTGASWFDWLRDNGFLNVIKAESKETTHYSYTMPELFYLARVSKEIPAKVVDFMQEVKISDETFNPEIVDRFIRICSGLPADQLARMVEKIRDEEWLRLMKSYSHISYDVKRLFDVLNGAKDTQSILVLAEAVLKVRKIDKIEKADAFHLNPFWIQDITETGVFDGLLNVNVSFIENALQVAYKAFAAVLALGEKGDKGEVFKIQEIYSLYDVDFFELGIDTDYVSRNDIKNLAATFTVLLNRIMSGKCDVPDDARKIFGEYLESLPDTRTVWRLKLAFWSLCPNVFAPELKEAFFRLFEHSNNPFEIAGGAEYKKALKKSFAQLPNDEQRRFVSEVFEKFPDQDDALAVPLLNSVYPSLTEQERDLAKQRYQRELDPDYTPTPSIGRGHAGMVVPQPPSDDAAKWDKPISDIIDALKTEWRPEALKMKYSETDFLRPIDSEGVGDKLKAEIKKRMSDYLVSAFLFFDREQLDAHYTYSYLRGIDSAFRGGSIQISDQGYASMLDLALAITKSGREKPFDTQPRGRGEFGWLANWTAVHSALADVLLGMLKMEAEGKLTGFKSNRGKILDVLKYLFTINDPVPEGEKFATAKLKTKTPQDTDYRVSDPYTIAINSVRGRTFEAFLQFIFLDGKKYTEDAKIKIDVDSKGLYEDLLNTEKTKAIMFMFGHYLAFFYYRDRDWVTGLLPKIFPKEADKERLYLAAWEGYISSALYKDLFKLLSDKYEATIRRPNTEDSGQRHATNPDEALATHLALAYVHFDDFKIESDLFKLFWEKPNSKRHSAFISFIGRHAVTRSPLEKWFLDDKDKITEKLKIFWDWALENCKEPEVLEEFEFWISTEVFEPNWLAERVDKTLEKNGGRMDWDIALNNAMLDLIKSSPEKALNILISYYIDGGNGEDRGYLSTSDKLKDYLTTLYANPKTRNGTYGLINGLLPLGNGRFWDLAKIVEEEKKD